MRRCTCWTGPIDQGLGSDILLVWAEPWDANVQCTQWYDVGAIFLRWAVPSACAMRTVTLLKLFVYGHFTPVRRVRSPTVEFSLFFCLPRCTSSRGAASCNRFGLFNGILHQQSRFGSEESQRISRGRFSFFYGISLVCVASANAGKKISRKMCGIWALFGSPSGDVFKYLDACLRIKHRGPDAFRIEGDHHLPKSCLAFHRLCVMDDLHGVCFYQEKKSGSIACMERIVYSIH